VRRREVLKAGALLAAPLAVAGRARAAGLTAVIYDSRHAASRRWARAQAGAQRIDARGDVLRIWRTLAPSGASLAGVTTWADFQVIAGCAAEARRPVRHDLLRPASGPGPTLVTWTVA